MDIVERGRATLICGTIIYSLVSDDENLGILVHNINTDEKCSVLDIPGGMEFVLEVLEKLEKGTVTPITAYDIIIDTVSELKYDLIDHNNAK